MPPAVPATVVAPPRARAVVATATPAATSADAAHREAVFRPVLNRVICKVNDTGIPFCGTCKVHEDCKRDEACVISPKTLLLECIAGDCKEDADCTANQVCRAILEDGTVKRCVAPGLRDQGERCNAYARAAEKQCQEGLVCVDQFCQTHCDKANPASCKDGTHCIDTREGPACESDPCTKVGCPEGDLCMTLASGKPHCFQAGSLGDNCFLHPCPSGEACIAAPGTQADTVAFQCKKSCDPMKPDACPKGFVCGRGSPDDETTACFKTCDPPHGLRCDLTKQELCTSLDEMLSLQGCVQSPDPFAVHEMPER